MQIIKKSGNNILKKKQGHGTVTIALVVYAKLTLPILVLCNLSNLKFGS